MSDLNFIIQIVDNVFVKMFHLKDVGSSIQGHAHSFDHITLLASGAVIMKHDNGVAEFTAPYLIVTPKGVSHDFVSTKPETVLCCIHAIRDGDGVDDVAPQDLSKEQAAMLLEKYSLIKNV